MNDVKILGVALYFFNDVTELRIQVLETDFIKYIDNPNDMIDKRLTIIHDGKHYSLTNIRYDRNVGHDDVKFIDVFYDVDVKITEMIYPKCPYHHYD